jgi:hypothetical protein
MLPCVSIRITQAILKDIVKDLAEIGAVSQILLHTYFRIGLRSADCFTLSECVKSF